MSSIPTKGCTVIIPTISSYSWATSVSSTLIKGCTNACLLHCQWVNLHGLHLHGRDALDVLRVGVTGLHLAFQRGVLKPCPSPGILTIIKEKIDVGINCESIITR